VRARQKSGYLRFFLNPGSLVLADAGQPAQGRSNTFSVTQSCVGKANKEKISAYVVLLRLRWDIYAKWKETGLWSADRSCGD